MEIALENDAEDVQLLEDRIEIITAPENLSQVVSAFDQAGIAVELSQVTRIPQMTVNVDVETAKTVLKLLETLEEHDDVQSVSTNLNYEAASVVALLQNS
jgi:transcriptional/translational regulatory protein YebC/TACO1